MTMRDQFDRLTGSLAGGEVLAESVVVSRRFPTHPCGIVFCGNEIHRGQYLLAHPELADGRASV